MTLALIVLNIAAFLLEQANPDAVIATFALWPPQAFAAGSPGFHAWQLVTYSVLHANITHIAFNLLGLYMFGSAIEAVLGGRRLLTLYVVSVVGGALVQLGVARFAQGPAYPTIGASAGVFGTLVAYAMLFPQRRVVLLFPPVPMPAWLFATGYAAIELVLGLSGSAPGVAHFAHLGGMAGAVVLVLYWAHRSRRERAG